MHPQGRPAPERHRSVYATRKRAPCPSSLSCTRTNSREFSHVNSVMAVVRPLRRHICSFSELTWQVCRRVRLRAARQDLWWDGASLANLVLTPRSPWLDHVAALPWRVHADGKVRILLVTSRTNGKWMMPKGWPMAGRSPAEAAGIEAKDEAGVEGQASERVIGSYHYISCSTTALPHRLRRWFTRQRVTDELLRWDEKGQRKRSWFQPKKAADAVFEPDLRRFLLDLREEALVMFAGSSVEVTS